jgi:outer membrane protein OmpA-like peptidoglycan-associated protein
MPPIMRMLSPLLIVAALASPAQAQVTVDLNALDQLKPAAPGTAERKAAPKPAPRPKVAKTPSKPASPEASQSPVTRPPVTTAEPKPPPGFHAPLPALPGNPPDGVALAPLPPPTPPTNKSNPPPAPVTPTAAGIGQAFPGGMRITFGGGQGELSQVSEKSLKALVEQAPKTETISYNVLAYAPGTPEDPSTSRRLSLARALAVRSVLMEAGVPSTRIYVRALGATAGSSTPDRVDVSVLGANAPPPDQATPPPADIPAPQAGAVKTP